MSGQSSMEIPEKNVQQLASGAEQVGPELDSLVADLYPTFLARYPEYGEYFEETDFRQQRRAVVRLFQEILGSIDQPSQLEETLDHLSSVHQRHGIPAEAYDDMGVVFLDLLKKYLGDDWNENHRQAWSLLWKQLTEALTGS